MHQPLKNYLLLLGLVVVVASGCRNAKPTVDMRTSKETFRVIADPKASYADWEEAFVAVRTLKVHEKPEFWVEIVNDHNHQYSSERRRRALIEFFRRHVKPESAVARFWEIKGIDGWFTEMNLYGASTYETSYIERKPGQSVWMYYPELLADTGATISFSLSKPLSRTELLNAINHKSKTGADAIIIEVEFGEPR